MRGDIVATQQSKVDTVRRVTISLAIEAAIGRPFARTGMNTMNVSSFVQPQQFVEMWTKMGATSLARMEEVEGAVREMQKKVLTRTVEAIDESARLMKESLAYSMKLTEEWQKITVENGKKLGGARSAGGEPSPPDKHAAAGAKTEAE
jgi:hypothetical protein